MGKKTYKNLDKENHNKLYGFLFAQVCGGVLKRGAMAKAAKLFHVHKSTISCLWSVWCANRKSMPSGNRNNGWPIFYDRDELKIYVEELPISCCRSIRALVDYLGILYNCVQKLMHQDKILFAHKSGIKPILNEENQLARVLFCLGQVAPQDDENEDNDPRWYQEFYN